MPYPVQEFPGMPIPADAEGRIQVEGIGPGQWVLVGAPGRVWRRVNTERDLIAVDLEPGGDLRIDCDFDRLDRSRRFRLQRWLMAPFGKRIPTTAVEIDDRWTGFGVPMRGVPVGIWSVTFAGWSDAEVPRRVFAVVRPERLATIDLTARLRNRIQGRITVPESWGTTGPHRVVLRPVLEEPWRERIGIVSLGADGRSLLVEFREVEPGDYDLEVPFWQWRARMPVLEGDATWTVSLPPAPAWISIDVRDPATGRSVDLRELCWCIPREGEDPDPSRPPTFRHGRPAHWFPLHPGTREIAAAPGTVIVRGCAFGYEDAEDSLDVAGGRRDAMVLAMRFRRDQVEDVRWIADAVSEVARFTPLSGGETLLDRLSMHPAAPEDSGRPEAADLEVHFLERVGYDLKDLDAFLERVEARATGHRVDAVDFGERDDGSDIWRPAGFRVRRARSSGTSQEGRSPRELLATFLAAAAQEELVRVTRLFASRDRIRWSMSARTEEALDAFRARLATLPGVHSLLPGVPDDTPRSFGLHDNLLRWRF